MLAVTGWAGARLLAPHGELPLPMNDAPSQVRMYAVVQGLAVSLGGLLFLGSLGGADPLESLGLGLLSVLDALSGYVLLVPLFFQPMSGRRGPRGERAVQTVALAVVTAWVMWPTSASIAPVFLIFPVLAWGAARTPQFQVAVQSVVVCAVGYGLTVNDLGPFYRTAEGRDDAVAPLLCFLFMLSCCYTVMLMVLAMTLLDGTARDARRAKATVERLLEAATGTVLVAVDPAGSITRLNAGAAATLGCTEAEVLGRSPAVFFPEEVARWRAEAEHTDADDFVAVLLELERSGSQRDLAYARGDGSQGFMSMRVSPIRDEETDETIGHLCAGEDVTRRHHTEQALSRALEREQQAVDQLRDADELKKELVSNFAHELRTPITSIMCFAELLVQDPSLDLDEENRDALERILRNSIRLQSLSTDLLTLSFAEGGRLELDRRELDLVPLVRDAVLEVQPKLKGRRLEVTADHPDSPVWVVGSDEALDRVVGNLLSNAIKYTPDGGSVAVTLTLEGPRAAIRVADTGIGISAEDQRHLFQRFFRSRDVTQKAIEGTGLGLSIVRSLVTALGGDVGVESTHGVGTVVTVTLPMRTPQAALSHA